MTKQELSDMGDRAIVRKLMGMRPSAEAVAFIATIISNPDAVQAVGELRRRYETATTQGQPIRRTRHGRQGVPTTVAIDEERFRAFFFMNRMPLSHVGPLFGRCKGWGSVIASKKSAGYWALDELAAALDMHVDELLRQICPPEEYERLCAV